LLQNLLILIVDRNDTTPQRDAFVDCNGPMHGLKKPGIARRLVAAFCESVGGGGGTNQTVHGPKMVAHAHLVAKKKTRAGFFQPSLRVRVGRGLKFQTRTRPAGNPHAKPAGRPNP
jgi:hypothetical protein